MALDLDTRQRTPLPSDEVRVLTPPDVARLRPGWQNRLRGDELRQLLVAYPERSVWLPGSREYVVVAPWRHRDEVASIQELVAVRQAETLLAALVERCRAAGDALVLMMEIDEVRPPGFYARAGFDLIEEVVTYEMERVAPVRDQGPLRFRRADPADRATLAELERIDHAAFPWLWWNSADEFAAYSRTPGVELFIGRQDERAVSYVGLTTYLGWGHLDRIAVDPAVQGQGYGRSSLAFAVNRLAAQGARRIGLSTQRENRRSQRMYERFGFRRTRGNDYRLYGVALREPDDGRRATEAGDAS